jgi:hypothetical protein
VQPYAILPAANCRTPINLPNSNRKYGRMLPSITPPPAAAHPSK